MRLDEILSYVVVIVAVIVALFIVKNNRKKPPRMLTRLVAANIGLDAFAIAIWGVFPAHPMDHLQAGLLSRRDRVNYSGRGVCGDAVWLG
jgi:uncharacterized membrane protein